MVFLQIKKENKLASLFFLLVNIPVPTTGDTASGISRVGAVELVPDGGSGKESITLKNKYLNYHLTICIIHGTRSIV